MIDVLLGCAVGAVLAGTLTSIYYRNQVRLIAGTRDRALLELAQLKIVHIPFSQVVTTTPPVDTEIVCTNGPLDYVQMHVVPKRTDAVSPPQPWPTPDPLPTPDIPVFGAPKRKSKPKPKKPKK